MRKIIVPLLCVVATCSAQKPNPQNFPVPVHVISSASRFYMFEGSKFRYFQVLEATVLGLPVELTSDNYDFAGVLKPGDYGAMISPRVQASNPDGYDVYHGYDLLLPDGQTRTFIVTRMGPAVGARKTR